MALIFLIILVILMKGSNYIKKTGITPDNKEFVSKPGMVYKECAYCHTKTDRTANYCSSCGKSFE